MDGKNSELLTTVFPDPKADADVVLRHLSTIKIRPGRGRKEFNKIPSLAESLIQTKGLIQPIVIERDENSPETFWIIAGERRYRAHLMASTVSPDFSWARTIERQYADDKTRKEIELFENTERENLTWQEQCTLLEQIHKHKMAGGPVDIVQDDGQIKKENWTLEKTAEAVGEAKGGVSTKINAARKLAKRPDIAKLVAHLPMGQAMREFERIEIIENVERLHKGGHLKLSNELLEGDAAVVLKTLEASSIDLILTDPPFGQSTLSLLEGESRGDSTSYTGLLKPDDNGTAESVKATMALVLPELFRVLKPSGHCYVFFAFDLFEFLCATARECGFEVEPAPLIWYKGKTTSGFKGYSYAPCYEPILFLHKPPRSKRLHNSGSKSLLEFGPPDKAEKTLLGGNHPFQKPQSLLSFLISNSSNVGDTVLDCFAGSGATLVAASELGRCAVGVEKDHERFLATQNMLTNRTKESK